MNLEQMAAFHNERNRLFAKPNGQALILDSTTYRTMCDELPSMDFEQATQALAAYREARPYKGFYWPKFLEHYSRDKTGARPQAAPACAPNDMEEMLNAAALADQRHEIQDFHKLPRDFVRECESRYVDWGIPISDRNRGWRLLCLDAFAGKEVDLYRVHTKRESKPIVSHAEEMTRQNMIEALRIENNQLRLEIEHMNHPNLVPF